MQLLQGEDVAIGSTCDHANHPTTILIGVLAGTIAIFGFAIIHRRQQKLIESVDTCCLTNLHGLPGLLGGFATIPVVIGLNVSSRL